MLGFIFLALDLPHNLHSGPHLMEGQRHPTVGGKSHEKQIVRKKLRYGMTN